MMNHALIDADFDATLFDRPLETDWFENASCGSQSSGKTKRFTARRKIKDITERPFKCRLCDMAFPQSAGLSRHRREIHGICRNTLGSNVLGSVATVVAMSSQVCSAFNSDESVVSPNCSLHNALCAGVGLLSREELYCEFRFLNSYLAEIQEQLLKKM